MHSALSTDVLRAGAAAALLLLTDSGSGRAEPAGLPEVLTLEEAARLLRVPPADLAATAEHGEVPARRIGTAWRFRRAALLDWLGGVTDSGEADAPPDANRSRPTADGPPPAMPAERLAATAGRGGGPTEPASAAEGAASRSAELPAAPETPIGESPDQATAQEVALRDISVLLGTGEVTLELGAFYTDRRETVTVPTSPFSDVQGELKNREFTTSLGARYGLLPGTQLSLSLPVSYQRAKLSAAGEQNTIRTRWETGDLRLGARQRVVSEGFNVPEVILGVTGGVPTNDAAYSVGGTISVAKSVDPAVLFAQAGYLHNFDHNSDDPSLLRASNVVDVSLGYAFALNDTLSLTTAVSGVFTDEAKFDNAKLEQDEQFNLQLALTSLLDEHLSIEPSVTFGLNDPGSLFIFGLRVPYSFRP